MEIPSDLLRSDETVVLKLRALYRSYGYRSFKMSKFEEYDLYGQNKEFLVSDSVITFTDTGGKLMALKPDVTLSIVKNSTDRAGEIKRLYYNENVYRISGKTHHYKEIMQTGLECIGDLSLYHLCETLLLAAKSLREISSDSVLNISHLGVISSVLAGCNLQSDYPALIRCIGEKNPHGVREICDRYRLPEEKTAFLVALTASYGPPDEVISALEQKTADPAVLSALKEFSKILSFCQEVPGVRIIADFSLTGDMNYYNGLIFRGYVKGLPSSVLSGGQYDRLMTKMGKASRAIGFAVYLDLLERLEKDSAYDVDVLLLADPTVSPGLVLKRVEELVKSGKRVSVEDRIPEKLRYVTLERLSKTEET